MFNVSLLVDLAAQVLLVAATNEGEVQTLKLSRASVLLVDLAERECARVAAALPGYAALRQALHQPLEHCARHLGRGGRADGDLQINPLSAAVGVHDVAAPHEVVLDD